MPETLKSRPTLDDIARAVGVSAATASNALSGKGRVSKELAATIQRTSRELGYVPSLAGRALRTGRSGVIGLVLPNIANPLFPRIAQAIEHSAVRHGYGVLIGDSHGDADAQSAAIERLIGRGADGLIVVPRRATRIGRIGRPVAVIDSPTTPENTVAADHRDGGVQIGRHLRERGHERIVIIGESRQSVVQNDRVDGIRGGLGSPAIEELWLEDFEDGERRELHLAACAARGVTAFAAVSDLIALSALTELQRAGLRVPDDVSVTGFDDLIWADAIAPTLTTMRMDFARIADIAVARVLHEIDGPSNPSPHRDLISSVPMTLIARQSSGLAPTRPRTRPL